MPSLPLLVPVFGPTANDCSALRFSAPPGAYVNRYARPRRSSLSTIEPSGSRVSPSGSAKLVIDICDTCAPASVTSTITAPLSGSTSSVPVTAVAVPAAPGSHTTADAPSSAGEGSTCDDTSA